MKPASFYLFAYWHDFRWVKFVGATVKMWDLAHNLSSSGHKVVLFLPRYRFNRANIPFQLVEIPFVNLPFLRIVSFNVCLAAVLFARFFFQRPGIVYSRRMTSIIPLLYSKATGAIFYYEVNDDPFRLSRNQGSRMAFFIRSIFSKGFDTVNIRACNKAFVISEGIKKKILDNIPNLDSAKLVLFPSGANTDLFKPLAKNECRCRLNLKLSGKYVLFMGTLLEHQGIDVLIKAAGDILRHVPGSKFLILGEGPAKEKWKEIVKSKKFSTHFVFPGQISYEEVAIWVGAADICVAPFKKSAGLRSPVKIFDYLSCAKPVVASRIPGTTDIFEESGAVSLVTAEDPKELAAGIIGLLTDDKLASEMGRKGRDLILTHYDRRKLARQQIDSAIACDMQA